MGSRNWTKANELLQRFRVSHPAAIVFLFMAQLASDKDRAPVYFGGWERLAKEALWRDAPEESDVRAQRSQKEQVRQAIAQLECAGLIERVGNGHRGRRAEYLLRLAEKGADES